MLNQSGEGKNECIEFFLSIEDILYFIGFDIADGGHATLLDDLLCAFPYYVVKHVFVVDAAFILKIQWCYYA